MGKGKGRRRRTIENQDGRRVCVEMVAFALHLIMVVLDDCKPLDAEDVDSTENINVATLTATPRP